MRIWRAPDESWVLQMAGHSRSYAVEPRGEYVFGIIADAPMRARRGREEYFVPPGQLLAWDPLATHIGSSVGGKSWYFRLIVLEVASCGCMPRSSARPPASNMTFSSPNGCIA